MLWGLPLRKEVVGDPGTQGGPREFAPLLLELWPEASLADPPLLLR